MIDAATLLSISAIKEKHGILALYGTNGLTTEHVDAIQRMETGTIFLNNGIVGYIQGYHNGHKLSGLGGEDGIYGIRATCRNARFICSTDPECPRRRQLPTMKVNYRPGIRV